VDVIKTKRGKLADMRGFISIQS